MQRKPCLSFPKDLNKYFRKDDGLRFSTLLVIREVKITMRAFSQERLKWKSQKMSSVPDNMEPLECSCSTVWTVNWAYHFGHKCLFSMGNLHPLGCVDSTSWYKRDRNVHKC